MGKHSYTDEQVQAIRDRAIVWTSDSHAEIAGRETEFGHVASIYGSFGWSDGVLYWSIPMADESGSISLRQHEGGLDQRAEKLEQIVREKIETALIKVATDIEANVINA